MQSKTIIIKYLKKSNNFMSETDYRLFHGRIVYSDGLPKIEFDKSITAQYKGKTRRFKSLALNPRRFTADKYPEGRRVTLSEKTLSKRLKPYMKDTSDIGESEASQYLDETDKGKS